MIVSSLAAPGRSLLHALTALLALTSLWGCRPTEESQTRLGYLGEFCRLDTDCRVDYYCEANTCVGGLDEAAVTCDAICQRLDGECGRNEPACFGSCNQTVRNWSVGAIEVFGTCMLGMSTPELTCEQAVREDAPSFCYLQIPLDSARQTRCDDFVEVARRGSPGVTDAQLAGLRQSCYIFARTRSEFDWADTDTCVSTDEVPLVDGVVVSCLNNTFGLNFRVP